MVVSAIASTPQYTWGQKETGEWQWTFQVGDLENVNITHWAVMPKAPEAGA
ncbi:hypothetical protein NGB11_004055 [Escherichia coli]|nr:hypothetical protein [Escherichia coli]